MVNLLDMYTEMAQEDEIAQLRVKAMELALCLHSANDPKADVYQTVEDVYKFFTTGNFPLPLKPR